MPSPWLSIPLRDYEGHMDSPAVEQLAALSDLFKRALDICHPESVAVVGVAGGNGLEHIDCATTKRILGLDINPHYLQEARRRFGTLPGLELHCVDLSEQSPDVGPVELVHAALLFEHTGLGLSLENTLSLIAPGGRLSVVLQLPSTQQDGVTATPYQSMQTLKQHFALIDINEFQRLLSAKGLHLTEQEFHSLPGGKTFWLGVFG